MVPIEYAHTIAVVAVSWPIVRSGSGIGHCAVG